MLRNPLVVVAVILESRSLGSVVIKLGLDSGTLRAGSSWAAKTLRGFLLMSFPNVVVGNLSLSISLALFVITTVPRTLRAANPSGITLFLIVIPGVDPGSSLFIRKTPYFISGFQVPACMRALE